MILQTFTTNTGSYILEPNLSPRQNYDLMELADCDQESHRDIRVRQGSYANTVKRREHIMDGGHPMLVR